MPNTAGAGSGGGGFRVTLLFRTAPVNGTNGINGLNGTDGQSVSFSTPNFSEVNPIISHLLVM